MMDQIKEIPWGVITPLLVIQFILVVVALVSLIRVTATRGPKWMWVLIILFISLLGPVLYFVVGRKEE